MIGNLIGKSTICNSISKPVEFDRVKTIFVTLRKRSGEDQVALVYQSSPHCLPRLSIRFVTFYGHSAKQWITEVHHEFDHPTYPFR
jgi:hypothetical protein